MHLIGPWQNANCTGSQFKIETEKMWLYTYLSFSCEVGMRDHLSVSSSYTARFDIISTSSGGIKLSTITDLQNITTSMCACVYVCV